MFLGIDNTNLVDPVQLEKIVLAKKVGQYLSDNKQGSDRKVVENIARMLAQDISDEVREVLSFELRACSEIPEDIVQQIIHDIDGVAAPFLATTQLFDDPAFAALIPALSEHLKGVIARRSDIGEHTINRLASTGERESVSFLVRNDSIILSETALQNVVSRFHPETLVMDQLSLRSGLPGSIVNRLLDLVSKHCKVALVERYQVSEAASKKVIDKSKNAVLFARISEMSLSQIHAFITEEKSNDRLSHKLILDMAERGSKPFLESAIAILSGVNKAAVREAFYLQDPQAFVSLIKQTGAKRDEFERYLEMAKKNRLRLESES